MGTNLQVRSFTPEPGRFVNPLYPPPGAKPEFVESSETSSCVGRYINLLYSEEHLKSALNLHTNLRHLLTPVHELGLLIYDALLELAPLDEFAHDADLSASASAAGTLEGAVEVDEVGARYRRARSKAEESLENLKGLQSEIEGLMRGHDKDRYEEPVKRAIRGAEQLLTKMVELDDNYQMQQRENKKPFKIRQKKLSSVAVKCADVAGQAEAARIENSKSGIEQEAVAELHRIEQRLFHVKRRLSRLRDNPSQKMTAELKSLAREGDAIHLALLILLEEAEPWREQPLSIEEIRESKTDSWCENFAWITPGRAVCKIRHLHEHHSLEPGYLDLTRPCKNCYPRFLRSISSKEEPDYPSLLCPDQKTDKTSAIAEQSGLETV